MLLRGSITLGKIRGIPLGINYTWFVIFILITLSLAQHYFPDFYPGWPKAVYWVVGLATSLLFFASLVAHELSHSLIAIRSGIPVRSITLFIFGGVARISREATRPSTELAMAAAGPLSSLTMAGVFFGLHLLTRDLNAQASAMTYYLALINVMLAIFNMVPGFPLDGGRVLRSLLWWLTGSYLRATRIASLAGRGIAYLMIFGGLLILMVFGNWVLGLWLVFIGWFLDMAAAASYRQAVLREALHGYHAGDLATRDCPQVPNWLTLRELADGYLRATGHRCFPVAQGGALEGVIDLKDLKKVSRGRWETTTVRQAMTSVDKVSPADTSDDALSVLEKMEEGDVECVPVAEFGRAVGVIEREKLSALARLRFGTRG